MMRGRDGAGRDYLAGIDLLRLVAAMAVVFFHVFFRGAAGDAYLSEPYPEIAPYALYGYLGVNLFFLISGFVIAWSAEGRKWDEFAFARFVRLYPGFLICMTITFIAMLTLAHPKLPVSASQYAANLMMVAPALKQPFMDGAYWSIVLELIFYGWMTVALMTGLFSRAKLELVAGWLAISLVNETLLGSGAVRMLLLTEYAPLFAAGILLRHIQSNGRSLEALLLLGSAFLLSCLTMQVTRGWMLQHYGVALSVTELVIANAAIHAMAVLAVVSGRRLRASAWTVAAGGLTYPLYLLHQHIGYAAIETLTPALGRWTAAFLVIAVVSLFAWLVWRFAERPAQRMLRALAARLPVAWMHRKPAVAQPPRTGIEAWARLT